MINIKKIVVVLLVIMSSSGFSADKHAAHWSYSGHTNADHWGDISRDFVTCKLGKEQSPINVQTKKTVHVQFHPIIVNYASIPAEIINNGHAIQVNLPEGSGINIDGKKFNLQQLHFHTPSEEKIDGKRFPLCIHFVHRNAEGDFAVIGVLIKDGKENTTLKPIFDNMPIEYGSKSKVDNFAVASVLPSSLAYYQYRGSLTTPPCSEGVLWYVLKTPIEVSMKQINQFRKLYKMNARPIQLLNGRVVNFSAPPGR